MAQTRRKNAGRSPNHTRQGQAKRDPSCANLHKASNDQNTHTKSPTTPFFLLFVVMSSSHGNWKDLLKACEEGNEGLIRYYMDHGVDPNYQHPEFFTAPLFEAIRNGRRDAVRVLLTYHPQTNIRLVEDSSGLMPIQVAMQQQQHTIVDMLLPLLQKEEEEEVTLETLCPTILVSMEKMNAPPQPQRRRHKDTNRNKLRDAVVEKLLDCGYRVILVHDNDDDVLLIESSMKQTTGNHKIHLVAASSFFTNEKETIREITQRDTPVSLWIRYASSSSLTNNNNNNNNKNTMGTDSSTIKTTTTIAQQHLVLIDNDDDNHNRPSSSSRLENATSSSLTFLSLGRVTLWDRLVFWSDWDDRRIRATVWLAKQCLENNNNNNNKDDDQEEEEKGRVLYNCHCANETQPSLSNLTF